MDTKTACNQCNANPDLIKTYFPHEECLSSLETEKVLRLGVIAVVAGIVLLAGIVFYIGTATTGSVSTICKDNQCTTNTGSICSSYSCTSSLSTSRSSTSTVITTSTTKSITHTTDSTLTSSTTTSTTDTSVCCNSSLYRLGFWVQEANIEEPTWQGGYSVGGNNPASLFFKTMFLTPPYPSSLEVISTSILLDEDTSLAPGQSGSYTASSLAFWGNLASLADAYPNIRLIFEIAFNSGSNVYGISAFKLMADSLANYSSVYGIGVDGEHSNLTSASLQSACASVLAVGKQCVNYYISQLNVVEPAGGYEVRLTNFPEQGGQVGELQLGGPTTVGLASGYYDHFPFPSNFTCPIGPDVVPPPDSPLTQEPQGWNQCVVSTELNATVSFSPTVERQFLELAVGFSDTQFTGVSGQNTNQLWDSPVLRNWIWTSPVYQLDFLVSTEAS